MLQERLGKIKDYFVGMEMYGGQWVVRVKYRPKWGAYPPEDGRIKVVSDESEPDLWWYCANDENVDIDSILDLIEETIDTNMEAIKKVELFKLKAAELKRIFSDESLSFQKLQRLRFVFDDKVVTDSKKSVVVEPKKKVSSKKELITQVDDEIKGHDIFESPKESVDDSVNKKKVTRKRVVEKPVVETVSSSEMTKEEIDDLRG